MAFIVETGVGVRGANAYVNVAYASEYLAERNRDAEGSWGLSTVTQKEGAIIAATDYIEKKYSSFFKGAPSVVFEDIPATATITFSGNPSANEAFVIGDETWVFVSNATDAAYAVLIGVDFGETAYNLAAALNRNSRHVRARATAMGLSLTALASGAGGGSTIFTSTVANAAITEFSGGVDGGAQSLSWPRVGAYDEGGVVIKGIPNCLKQAVVEYAVRALSALLLPDPALDAYSGALKSRVQKVGPIEEQYEYVSGSVGKNLFKPYPSADMLIRPLLLETGRVVRG